MRYSIEILRDNANKLIGVIPFVLMMIHIWAYSIMCYSWWIEHDGYVLKEWVQTLYDFLKQFFDVGIIGYILMLATSKHYNRLAWVSYWCLIVLWLLSTIYILSSWTVDLYFAIIFVVIFGIFAIYTLQAVTNRILN